MRTIKLNKEQFRIWRVNAPTTEENGLGARDLLKKQLLEQNNGLSFRLRSPMGPFIGTVRGENSTVSGAPMGTPNGAPAPESCLCKDFAGTKPGSHHPICQHRQAWENGRGLTITQPETNLNPAMNVTSQRVAAPIDTTPRVQHMQVPQAQRAHPAMIPTTNAPVASSVNSPIPTKVVELPKVQAQVQAVVALISPEQCDCRQFAKPTGADPKQHHFVCPHFDKWKAAHPDSPLVEPGQVATAGDTEKPPPSDMVLVDLDTQTVLRDATSEEIASARAEESKTGTPLVTLDEHVYGVVPRPMAALNSEA